MTATTTTSTHFRVVTPRARRPAARRVQPRELAPPTGRRRRRQASLPRRVARQLTTPAGALLLVSLFSAAGYRAWGAVDDQRLQAQLAEPKTWAALPVALAPHSEARLVTHHANGFVHYRFDVTATQVTDPVAMEKTMRGIDFVIRLLDREGFSVAVLRPSAPLHMTARDGTALFTVSDVIGSSKQSYAAVTGWKVEWEETNQVSSRADFFSATDATLADSDEFVTHAERNEAAHEIGSSPADLN
jgi:hypothetical protein